MRTYTRREVLGRIGKVASAAGAVALCSSGRAAETRKRPNIVLIYVDDMGWTDLGCFGSKFYETPNIDRLCGQGMKLTSTYAACTVCSPSRAALLTGRYPARTGITQWIRGGNRKGEGYQTKSRRPLLEPINQGYLRPREITIAELLKTVGYTSCHVGKWHLGGGPYRPESQGFDFNYGGCERGSPPGYYDPYRNALPGLKGRKAGEYLTDRESDEAVRFLRKHRDRPLFLYMSHYAVHMPLQGRADLVEKYKAKQPVGKHKSPVYAAMVESVDQSTGKILRALDELGLADKTIVIFTTDNGGVDAIANGHARAYVTNNAPLRSGKCWPYEGGIRVPGIVRWPGVTKPGSASDEPIIGMDFFTTVCTAAGAKVPTDRPIDGLDLRPVLSGKGSLKRDAIFWHRPHYQHATPHGTVRAGDWKLIRYYEDDAVELFNLADDLSETTNLADKQPAKVKDLLAKLDAWLKATGAKMPIPNPNYGGGSRKPRPAKNTRRA